MKRLLLIRHAKSSWADPELEDMARPLNERGRIAARVTGAWLAEKGLGPDFVFLSPALRCRETWERIRAVLGDAPEPKVEKALYMADPETMLRVLRTAPKAAGTVFLIGHQPGISSFARKLAASAVPAGCARAFTKFPTGAAALIEFEAEDWTGAGFGLGAFRSFATPKELV
ncbi:MAG TPA: histidine phosphatase family protein [Paracoccaceae bacterium]|nr:histidine phosphatase family protein [Paracoccaceae bacterium]